MELLNELMHTQLCTDLKYEVLPQLPHIKLLFIWDLLFFIKYVPLD